MKRANKNLPRPPPRRPLPVKVTLGNGGWWARIDKPGLFMERGPYRYRWMAAAAFPIQRWTW